VSSRVLRAACTYLLRVCTLHVLCKVKRKLIRCVFAKYNVLCRVKRKAVKTPPLLLIVNCMFDPQQFYGENAAFIVDG
jgi:hypothetical protein